MFKAVVFAAVCGVVVAIGCSQGNSLGPQVANVIHQQTIIGTWCDKEGTEKMKFFTNGTCSFNGITGWRDGTYELVDGQRLNVTIPGFIWGEHKVNLDYTLSGDSLTLTFTALGESETHTLTRK